MNEIDEYLQSKNHYNSYRRGTKYKKNYGQQNRNYNKYRKRNYNNRRNGNDNWIEQQKQDKQIIYDTMDRMALVVGNDSEKFQEYLDVQSRFEKYSVGNCLVILQNAPNSTQIKDVQSWNEKGVNLKRNPKSIKILEPVKSKNGNIYYNVKKVYDISQTDALKQKTVNHGNRQLIEAILDCGVSWEGVDNLENGEIGIKYNSEKNMLYICRGMETEIFFKELLQEIAKIEMKDDKDRNMKDFRSYCISYMMCRKYEIDVADFDFRNLPSEITNLKNGKEIRYELDIIRKHFEEIDTRVMESFQRNYKEKSKSIPER